VCDAEAEALWTGHPRQQRRQQQQPIIDWQQLLIFATVP